MRPGQLDALAWLLERLGRAASYPASLDRRAQLLVGELVAADGDDLGVDVDLETSTPSTSETSSRIDMPQWPQWIAGTL